MDLNPIVLSIPIYFLLIGIELLIQQFSKARLYRFNDAVSNIGCGITSQLTGLFFKIFSIGIYQVIYEHLAIWHIPSNVYSLVILFILVDFCYYWAHRKSHEINLFWGGHVVHHQSEEYNLSVALRQSSFQVIWTFAFYLPLAVIGFNTLDFALMAGLTTIYQFWIHTETIKKIGPFEYIFNTPSHHRVHHGRDPKYIDKNHAGVFIIWDKMFGTFQKEEEKPTYGITRPLKSWNPVWANFDHYTTMAKDFQRINSWKDRIRYLFKKPGWLPDDLGGYRAPQEVDKRSAVKYDARPFQVRVNYYVLFQFLVALFGTAFFLFNQASMELGEKSLITLVIIVTIVNCSALFENKLWVSRLEFFRVFIISGSIIYLSLMEITPMIWAAYGVSYLIISMSWLSVLLLPKKKLA